jgi:riboflavin kinase/FMN adenylyltransferase
VLGFDKDLYGSKLRLGFVQRLRDEKKFDGVEALKGQIAADRARAEDLFARMGL